MKYLKNIISFEDLKKKYKEQALLHHPDRGGAVEAMQEVNSEYEVLFPIWQSKYNETATKKDTETTKESRRNFYTAYGWAGDNYDSNLTLKEIAVIVRNYVKEKYPTMKFSVRTEYASMCQELHVALMEATVPAYKTPEQWTEEEKEKQEREDLRNKDYNYSDEDIERLHKKAFYTEQIAATIADVDKFVNSYNFDDSDSMIDYFHNNFYYFGCKVGKYDKPFKVVERTARITATSKKKTEQPLGTITTGTLDLEIIEDTDTRDNSQLFVVKVNEKLSRDEYMKVQKQMREHGGYYSRFKKGFIFKQEPQNLLIAL